jgi:hypothetical protein
LVPEHRMADKQIVLFRLKKGKWGSDLSVNSYI